MSQRVVQSESACCGSGNAERRTGSGGGMKDNNCGPRRRFKVSGSTFEVDGKYELMKPIGHGAYGVVISALNRETGEKVAIKKVSKAFDDLVDAKRILREITLLRMFCHENIINIVDILVPPSSEEFEDVYIVSDLMETDLHRIINSRQDLSLDHVQYFLYQVLRALKYMHSSNVLHRDLKPSNLLLNSNCDLKVCDLGLARDIESGCEELTEYVVTRWYRAPEIMLACHEYSKAIDMWSAGCVFAELMLRRPFFPGDNYIDQLTIICGTLGKPDANELEFVTTEKARRFILNLPDSKPKSLHDQFPATATDEALDLLAKMLEFNPGSRISVEEALAHPFMENLHAAKDEPVANFEFCFGFEEEELTRHRLKELMWEEMRRYHPEQGPWKGQASRKKLQSQGAAEAIRSQATPNTSRKFSHLGAELRSSPGVPTEIPPPPSQTRNTSTTTKSGSPCTSSSTSSSSDSGRISRPPGDANIGNATGSDDAHEQHDQGVAQECATKKDAPTLSIAEDMHRYGEEGQRGEDRKQPNRRHIVATHREESHLSDSTPPPAPAIDSVVSSSSGRNSRFSTSPNHTPARGDAIHPEATETLPQEGERRIEKASSSPCCCVSGSYDGSRYANSIMPRRCARRESSPSDTTDEIQERGSDVVVSRGLRKQHVADRVGRGDNEPGYTSVRARRVEMSPTPATIADKRKHTPQLPSLTGGRADNDTAQIHCSSELDSSDSGELMSGLKVPWANTRATARVKAVLRARQGMDSSSREKLDGGGAGNSPWSEGAVATADGASGSANRRIRSTSYVGVPNVRWETPRKRTLHEAEETASKSRIIQGKRDGPVSANTVCPSRGNKVAPADGAADFIWKVGLTKDSREKAPNMFAKKRKASVDGAISG